VNAGAHLTLKTSDTLSDESLQVLALGADIRVEQGATLTATGGINFADGDRSLLVDGTLDLGPGIGKLASRNVGSATNNVRLQFGDAAKLDIELGGDAHDELAISSGTATLGGQLSLERFDGFVPTIGEDFDVITADGAVTGAFDTLVGGVIDLGLAGSRDDIGLAVRYLHENDLSVVRVRASLLGDVDLDDAVDAADYEQVVSKLGMPQRCQRRRTR
jgi:hypothetical protein